MNNNQKTKKQIFLIYACDICCTTSSHKLIMATTSERKLKSFIAKQIKNESFDYSNGTPMSTTTKKVSQFKADFEKLTSREINDNLVYGFYEFVYDGEEI